MRGTVTDIYIHSFRFTDNSDLADEAPSCLSDEEVARANRFKVEHARRDFLISHRLLRKTLSGYLDTDAASIRYCYGEHGKPHLDTPGQQGLHFNLSHSGDRILVAICTDCEIGVDIELIQERSNPLQLSRHFMSAEETSKLAGLTDPDAQREFFFTLWTRKEAYIKCLGKGFFHAINETDMNELAAGIHVPSCEAHRAYRVIDLDIAGDYKAAVAVRIADNGLSGPIKIKVVEQ
jgi:4'-phosphopantetheinyl transferase